MTKAIDDLVRDLNHALEHRPTDPQIAAVLALVGLSPAQRLNAVRECLARWVADPRLAPSVRAYAAEKLAALPPG